MRFKLYNELESEDFKRGFKEGMESVFALGVLAGIMVAGVLVYFFTV